VADVGKSRVRKISNVIISTVAGNGNAGFSGDGGSAVNAQLYFPNGVAVDAQGNLFVADTNNNRVRKVSTNGVITTVAGNGAAGFSGDGGSAASAEISQPRYLAVDGSGNVFIADTGNNRVRKVSASGVISSLAGTGVAGFSGEGGPAANAQLQNPQGVAVDHSGNLFIVDANDYRVREVSAAGVITVVGTGGNGFLGDGGQATSAQISGSAGVAVDAAGDLFIADYYNSRVREVSANGIIKTVAGTGAGYSGDNGPATSAQTAPGGVASDASGNLYIADNSGLRKISANGIITTVAGTGACCGPGASGVSATSTEISPL
jgi:sugar lactone lactonase YvrE